MTGGLAKDLRRLVNELAAPLGHLGGMDLVLGGDLVEGSFPRQGLKGDLGLELR